MRQQRRGRKRESACDRWEREYPGQFLYIIRFGPDPRPRRRRKQRTPISPWRPPVVMRPRPPADTPKILAHLEDA